MEQQGKRGLSSSNQTVLALWRDAVTCSRGEMDSFDSTALCWGRGGAGGLLAGLCEKPRRDAKMRLFVRRRLASARALLGMCTIFT